MNLHHNLAQETGASFLKANYSEFFLFRIMKQLH